MSRKISSNVHKLNGSYRKDRHEKKTNKLISSVYPKTPEYIVDFQGVVDVWNEIKSTMKDADVYTKADSNKLARLCILEALFRQSPLKFTEVGVRLTQIRLLENDLYLSPESRSHLCDKDENKENPFDKYK